MTDQEMDTDEEVTNEDSKGKDHNPLRPVVDSLRHQLKEAKQSRNNMEERLASLEKSTNKAKTLLAEDANWDEFAKENHDDPIVSAIRSLDAQMSSMYDYLDQKAVSERDTWYEKELLEKAEKYPELEEFFTETDDGRMPEIEEFLDDVRKRNITNKRDFDREFKAHFADSIIQAVSGGTRRQKTKRRAQDAAGFNGGSKIDSSRVSTPVATDKQQEAREILEDILAQ